MAFSAWLRGQSTADEWRAVSTQSPVLWNDQTIMFGPIEPTIEANRIYILWSNILLSIVLLVANKLTKKQSTEGSIGLKVKPLISWPTNRTALLMANDSIVGSDSLLAIDFRYYYTSLDISFAFVLRFGNRLSVISGKSLAILFDTKTNGTKKLVLTDD